MVKEEFLALDEDSRFAWLKEQTNAGKDVQAGEAAARRPSRSAKALSRDSTW